MDESLLRKHVLKTYCCCAHGKHNKISDGCDGDPYSRMSHGIPYSLRDAPGNSLHLVLGFNVVEGLDNYKHVIDSEPNQETRDDGVHGTIGEPKQGAEAQGRHESQATGSDTQGSQGSLVD